MFSTTDILNDALILLGDQPVLTADSTTVVGRRYIHIYEKTRDYLLSTHAWSFAIKRAEIAALTSTPAWGFYYEYELPSDCLTLLQVDETFDNLGGTDYVNYDNSPYKLEGRKILTNKESPLKIRYISRIDNSGEFDPSFVNMLSIMIAIKLCNIQTNNGAMTDRLSKLYSEAYSNALKRNAIEKSTQSNLSGSWVMGRL